MSRRIIQQHTPHTWSEICIEGNELVCYEYEQEPDKPVMWLEGSEYRFSKHLRSVKRIGSKKMVELFKQQGY